MAKVDISGTIEQCSKRGVVLVQMGKSAYRGFIGAYSVIYYPSAGTWIYRGRNHSGDDAAFVQWVARTVVTVH